MSKQKTPRAGGKPNAPTASGPAPVMHLGSSVRVAELLAIAREHHQAGRLAEAEPLYRKILALDPNQADCLQLLGVLATQVGRSDIAAELISKAIAGNSRAPTFHNSLGNALGNLGKLAEAAASFRRAIELKPDFPEAHSNLGNALTDLGEYDEATAAYRRAIELKPDYNKAHSNLLLCLNYSADITAETLLAEHRRWDARHGGRLRPTAADYPNARDPNRRLRVGYVSGDLRNHAVGYFMTNVLVAHDRASVESFCYSNSAILDDRTATLRASTDHWRNLVGVSDDDAAATIRRDGIDILVDLSGHTANNRLLVFARKPAPLQASWLGYPGTTGLSSIDYLLMDAAAVPPGAERWCSEAVVRLPHGRFCYAPPVYAPAVADAVTLNDAPLTFGSFNNRAKIGPDVVALWVAVLEAVPGSRLTLKWRSLADPTTRDRLSGAFAAAGLAPERLELRGSSPHARMLAEYGEIDIALDPFPFSGGLTSCEALWMGVPVVTLPGERPASRQTLGFLEAIGLGELAARSEADYVRIAAALAADTDRRSRLRRTLRPRMTASSLCDGRLFTSALEAALRQIWRRWCAGEPAVAFDAPAIAARAAPLIARP
jgi:protein O-GlcNAc transferase